MKTKEEAQQALRKHAVAQKRWRNTNPGRRKAPDWQQRYLAEVLNETAGPYHEVILMVRGAASVTFSCYMSKREIREALREDYQDSDTPHLHEGRTVLERGRQLPEDAADSTPPPIREPSSPPRTSRN